MLDFGTLVRERLEEQKLTPYRAAIDAQLPEDAVRHAADGHVPRLDRAIEICNAIGLELTVRPKGLASEKSTVETQPSLSHEDSRVRRLQESLLMMSLALDDLMPAETWGTADSDGLHTIGDGWFRVWMARHGAIPERCGMTDVDSDEMEPTLPPGSAVVVDRSCRKPSASGVFMLRIGKRRLFRRLRRDESQRWVAYGDHPLCEDSKPMRRPNVVGKLLWSAHDLRDNTGPFAKSPRAVYMLFARQVRRPALISAARGIPLEHLEAFALDAALKAEEQYAEILSAAGRR